MTCQSEVGDHRPRGPIRLRGQNHIAALQISMDYLLAMRLRQPFAKLARNESRFALRQAPSTNPLGERLPVQKLHAEEFDLAAVGIRAVDLKNLAYIRMADFACMP